MTTQDSTLPLRKQRFFFPVESRVNNFAGFSTLCLALISTDQY